MLRRTVCFGPVLLCCTMFVGLGESLAMPGYGPKPIPPEEKECRPSPSSTTTRFGWVDLLRCAPLTTKNLRDIRNEGVVHGEMRTFLQNRGASQNVYISGQKGIELVKEYLDPTTSRLRTPAEIVRDNPGFVVEATVNAVRFRMVSYFDYDRTNRSLVKTLHLTDFFIRPPRALDPEHYFIKAAPGLSCEELIKQRMHKVLLLDEWKVDAGGWHHNRSELKRELVLVSEDQWRALQDTTNTVSPFDDIYDAPNWNFREEQQVQKFIRELNRAKAIEIHSGKMFVILGDGKLVPYDTVD